MFKKLSLCYHLSRKKCKSSYFFCLDPFNPKGSGATGTPRQEGRNGITGKIPKQKAKLNEKKDGKKGKDLVTYS